MEYKKFIKGQQVWCHARVSLLLPYRSPMCGVVQYKLPKILRFFVRLFIMFDTKGDFYCVKMQDGKKIFYSETVITDINKQISICERVWGVNEECKKQSQMIAHFALVSWYNNMKLFKI